MAIYNYLPSFNYIEANNLKALQPGFVVAQVGIIPAAAASDLLVTKGSAKYLENGTIVSLTENGIVAPVAGAPLFIVYSDPLNTVVDSDKYFATEFVENTDHDFVVTGECPRLVQLIPGDEWMGTAQYDLSAQSALNGRIIKIQSTSALAQGETWYGVGMPNGDTGYHYMFIK